MNDYIPAYQTATRELAELRQMLQEICRQIDDKRKVGEPRYIDSTPGLRKWWENYKCVDREIKAEDQAEVRLVEARAKALDKLTDEERKALGLLPRS